MEFHLTTFLAQIVNLFLLIWILKRFLYRPVLAIIEKRRQKIIHELQDAESQLAHAEQTQNALTKLKEDFERHRQKRLDDLESEIHQRHTQMMQELDNDFKNRQQKLQNELDTNWTTAENTIHQMIGREFISLAHKILAEWSHQSPVDQMLLLFEKKIKGMAASKKKQIQNLLKQQKSIQITTSGTLNKTQQNALKNILHKNFALPEKIRFQYRKRSDLILGLEIRIGDFLLDWSLETYLDEMNQHLKQGIAGLIVPTKRKADK